MTPSTTRPIVAVDIGNSRIKLGLFDARINGPTQLPSPRKTHDIAPGVTLSGRAPAEAAERLGTIDAWLDGASVGSCDWWIGSVQRAVTSQLVMWLRDRGAERITLVASSDLPLKIELPRPDMVGIDRLLGAVAANHLRSSGRPAVIADLGTAITVDVVSAEGAFLGGSILPGIGLSARALHEFTDLLPLVDMQHLSQSPPAWGANTVEAMSCGLFWGAVGGVARLVELAAQQLDASPDVFLTGGAAPRVAPLVAPGARYEPHLVLAGIAIAASHSEG
ncbi:MAG TPA: type III pantothenate kinase [Pirellulales bacterium]|nr:type III pantothenate kinase [Pirellulales bacterium]